MVRLKFSIPSVLIISKLTLIRSSQKAPGRYISGPDPTARCIWSIRTAMSVPASLPTSSLMAPMATMLGAPAAAVGQFLDASSRNVAYMASQPVKPAPDDRPINMPVYSVLGRL